MWKKTVLVVSIFILQFHSVFSQINNQTERNAIFLYNFAKYINWSVFVDQRAIIIGVAGDDEVYNYMRQHFINRSIGIRKIKIRKVTGIDAADCQILYLSKPETPQSRTLLEYIRHLQVLVVTDCRMINPEIDIAIISNGPEAVDYSIQINKNNIRLKGLKLSTEFMFFSRESTLVDPCPIPFSTDLLFSTKQETLGV